MAKGKIDVKALANQAAKMSNHNETKTTADFPIPPAGKTVGRFVEYVELGVQKKVYAGESKFVPQVRLGFELLHPKNIREVEIDGVKTKRADRINPRPYTLSLHEKASFYKLFKQMQYGRAEILHMSQMLGEPFVFDITHNKVKGTDGKEKVYANIGAILPPQVEDPIAGTVKKLAVPPALSDLKLFLFDNPTQETWDSLFIDGSKEVKDAAGKVSQKSKNWLQELILKADNFDGSALSDLLGGAGDLPEFQEEAAEEVSEEADLDGLDAEVAIEDEVEEEEAPAPVAKSIAKKPLTVVKNTTTAKAPAKTVAKSSTKAAAPTATSKATAPSKAPAKAVAAKKVASGGKTATQEAVDELGLFDE